MARTGERTPQEMTSYAHGKGIASYFFGDRGYWRRACASEATQDVDVLALDGKGVHATQTDTYVQNAGSVKVLIANGLNRVDWAPNTLLPLGSDQVNDRLLFQQNAEDWRARNVKEVI